MRRSIRPGADDAEATPTASRPGIDFEEGVRPCFVAAIDAKVGILGYDEGECATMLAAKLACGVVPLSKSPHLRTKVVPGPSVGQRQFVVRVGSDLGPEEVHS